MANALLHLPEIQGMELNHVQLLIKDFSDNKAMNFASIYRARRKDPQLILLTCLLGFFGFAGVHRFLTNQIGMGILYFFTCGLCLIGTIVDAVNHQTLAFEYNRPIASEVAMLVERMAE